jgi:hypothetical protein
MTDPNPPGYPLTVEIVVTGEFRGRIVPARRLRDDELVTHDVAWYACLIDGREVFGPGEWLRLIPTP